MNKKRWIPSDKGSLLKGALFDAKDPRILNICAVTQKACMEFSIYDQNKLRRTALILHYKEDNSKVIGVELSEVDVGQCGPTFIDVYVNRRLGHLGIVPEAPYPLRAKRSGNRIYRYILPADARGLGLDDDTMNNKE